MFVAVLTTVVLGAVDYSILLSQRSFAQSFDLRHVPKLEDLLLILKLHTHTKGKCRYSLENGFYAGLTQY